VLQFEEVPLEPRSVERADKVAPAEELPVTTLNGNAQPATGAEPSEMDSGIEVILELPPRAPLALTTDEDKLVRHIATQTITRLMGLKRIGNSGASEQLQGWIDGAGWNTPLRDLLVTQFELRSTSLIDDVEALASKVQHRGKEITCCDFARFLTVDFKRIPTEIQRVLRVTACVPLSYNEEAASLLIGGVNGIATVITADVIDKLQLTQVATPFVTPMRIQWNEWVERLKLYGI
jgi:hypothetical protein